MDGLPVMGRNGAAPETGPCNASALSRPTSGASVLRTSSSAVLEPNLHTEVETVGPEVAALERGHWPIPGRGAEPRVGRDLGAVQPQVDLLTRPGDVRPVQE